MYLRAARCGNRLGSVGQFINFYLFEPDNEQPNAQPVKVLFVSRRSVSLVCLDVLDAN
jgi:hypothetical protein